MLLPPSRRCSRRRAAAAAITAAAFGLPFLGGVLVSGCGGGGGGSASRNTRTTPVTVNIVWPARSRTVNAPASAQSCIISLRTGDPNTGGPVDFTLINRDLTKPGGYTQTWTSPESVRIGRTEVNVRFYAGTGTPRPNPGNPNQEQPAPEAASIVSDTTLDVEIKDDGTGIPDLSPTSRVASVAIAPNQTVNFGSTTTINFDARDTSNALITGVPQGAGSFSAPQNSVPAISPSGDMTGNLLGNTQVTVSVDGKTSNPVRVSSIIGTNALTTTASGLRFRETAAGTGAEAATGQSVSVRYALYLSADGNLDSGNYTLVQENLSGSGTPLTFTLGSGQTVAGFNEGVTGMKSGATRLLVILPALGYGDNPPAGSGIPAGATLIFIVRREP